VARTFGLRTISTGGVRKTTGLWSEIANPLTACCWTRVVVDRAATARYVFTIENPQSQYGQIGWRGDNVFVLDSGGLQYSVGVPPVNGQWFFVAMTSNTSESAAYWARYGEQFTSASGVGIATSGNPPTLLVFGNDSVDDWADVEFAHMRVWNRVLTPTELYREMYSPNPVLRANLYADIVGLNDRSNRARTGEWTIGSTAGSRELQLEGTPLWVPMHFELTYGYVSEAHQFLAQGLSSNCTVATPPNIKEGDILVYAISIDTASSTVTWPTNFNEVSGSPTTSSYDGQRLHVATKKATGLETGNLVAVKSGSDRHHAFITAYRGMDQTSWIDGSLGTVSSSSGNASPQSPAAGSVTTTINGDIILYIATLDAGTNPSNASWTPPSGFTERIDITAEFNDITIADKVQTTAGATGTAAGTVTFSGNAGYIAFQLALKKAGGSAPAIFAIDSVTPNVLYEGLTSIVIAGAAFGTTQGNSKVLLDGTEQTVTAWSDTSITFNTVSPSQWASSRKLEVRKIP
jgi:hypothetical protein